MLNTGDGQDRFVRTLDFNHLRLAERRYAINQPGRGCRKHHPARRTDRFHPLRHATCSPTAV
jgi:hypothetical protein